MAQYGRNIYNVFGSIYDDDFLDLVNDVLDRLDLGGEVEQEKVYEAIDSSLIYYHQQWTMMKYYQNPQDANYEEAFESFVNDMFSVVDDILSVEEV
jgi:hypothetical protein